MIKCAFSLMKNYHFGLQLHVLKWFGRVESIPLRTRKRSARMRAAAPDRPLGLWTCVGTAGTGTGTWGGVVTHGAMFCGLVKALKSISVGTDGGSRALTCPFGLKSGSLWRARCRRRNDMLDKVWRSVKRLQTLLSYQTGSSVEEQQDEAAVGTHHSGA